MLARSPLYAMLCASNFAARASGIGKRASSVAGVLWVSCRPLSIVKSLPSVIERPTSSG